MRLNLPLLAALYLALPACIFAANFFPSVQGYAVVGLWVYVLMGILNGRKIHRDKLRPMTVSLLLSFAGLVVWVSGVLPPFYQNSDWAKHYAMFNELAEKTWPPTVAMDGILYQLRYPMGFYMIPALVTKLFGPGLLDFAIFAWMSIGVFLALALALKDQTNPAKVIASSVVILCFSGLDVIGFLFTQHQAGPALHLEWWASIGQISSSTTNLFWAPQHTIPAWVAGILLFQYPKQSIGFAAPLAAAVLGWSPFAMVGLVPMALWCLIRTGPRAAITLPNIAGLLIGAITLLFLTKDSGGVPVTFIWHHPLFSVPRLLSFIAIEFGLICCAIAYASPSTRLAVGLMGGFMILTSLVWIGASGDLLMRGPAASLAVLGAISAKVIFDHFSWKSLPLMAALSVGSITPICELVRAVQYPRPQMQQTTLSQVIAESPAAFRAQYLARDSD